MSGTRASLKILQDRRAQVAAEMEASRVRLQELDGLIRAMGGMPAQQLPMPFADARKPRRGDLKEVVLALYAEIGEAGLSSTECVAAAKERRGVELQPASVSSLLSRLKADDVLIFDGARYRLKRFAGPRSAA